MSFQPGEQVTWYPGRHPCKPITVTFIKASKQRVHIRVPNGDGTERIVCVLADNIEKVREQ